MSRTVLSDTSCLILFKKIGQIELLHQIYEELTITPEIRDEYKTNLPDWVNIKPVINHQKITEYAKIADFGEASLIALAQEVSAPLLLIDDKRGRKLAELLHIEMTGTLGTLLKAKRKGIIKSVKPLLYDLKEINFRISVNLEHYILKKAGE